MTENLAVRFSGVLIMFALGAYSKTIEVRCQNPGHSIEKALKHADPGDVIDIRGICNEKFKIETSHITLDGNGTAIIQGTGIGNQLFNPLIGIDGAQGVVIKRLRVENGSGEGILAENGAAVSLRNVTLRGNNVGLAVVASSTAEITDTSIEHNFIGVGLLTESSLVLKGRVVASNNQDIGFDVTGNSTIEIRGAQVEVNNNGRHGITMDGSRLIVLGIPQSHGSSLTVSRNGSNGILLGQSSLSFFGAPGAYKVTLSRNAAVGLRAVLGARILSPQGSALFNIEGNSTGVTFESDAGALIVGGLTVRNNGTGVLADGAGVFTLVAIPPAPSAITGNTNRDFDARFGSRIRLIGVSAGPNVACEPTVISQGLACP